MCNALQCHELIKNIDSQTIAHQRLYVISKTIYTEH